MRYFPSLFGISYDILTTVPYFLIMSSITNKIFSLSLSLSLPLSFSLPFYLCSVYFDSILSPPLDLYPHLALYRNLACNLFIFLKHSTHSFSVASQDFVQSSMSQFEFYTKVLEKMGFESPQTSKMPGATCSCLDVKNTPGQVRAGDLQRVRLTS